MSKDLIDKLGGQLQAALAKYQKTGKVEDENAALKLQNERQSRQIDLLLSQRFQKDRKIGKLENTVRALRQSHGFKEVDEQGDTKLYVFRDADAQELAKSVFGSAGQ